MEANKQKIGSRDVKQLIDQFNGKVDDKLSEDVYTEVITLEDDRVILLLKNGGMLYSSRDEYIRETSQEEESFVVGPPEIDEIFLTKIPQHIASLSELLEVGLSTNDSIAQLQIADSAVYKFGIQNLTEKEFFLPMLAYCGQMIANETNGMWEVRRVDNEDARLLIIGEDGKEYDLFDLDLDEDIRNGVEDFSLAARVELQIDPGQPFDAFEPGKEIIRRWNKERGFE